MRYFNKITGAIIDVNSEINGDNWEPVKERKSRGKKAEAETEVEIEAETESAESESEGDS